MEGHHQGNATEDATTFGLMDTAQGCSGHNENLQKPVKDDLPYHHTSLVQGGSDGEARAADTSAEDDDGTTEGSAEKVTSEANGKSLDGFFRNELPLDRINHHLKLGNTQEEHFIQLPANLEHTQDPSISPDEEGIMNVSAEVKYSTTYDAKKKQLSLIHI